MSSSGDKASASEKKGACGISLDAQQARIVTIACSIGSACHTAHGMHLLDELIKKSTLKGIDKWWENVVDCGLNWEIGLNLVIKLAVFKIGDVEEIGAGKL